MPLVQFVLRRPHTHIYEIAPSRPVAHRDGPGGRAQAEGQAWYRCTVLRLVLGRISQLPTQTLLTASWANQALSGGGVRPEGHLAGQSMG